MSNENIELSCANNLGNKSRDIEARTDSFFHTGKGTITLIRHVSLYRAETVHGVITHEKIMNNKDCREC